jgi:hypothetical protein
LVQAVQDTTQEPQLQVVMAVAVVRLVLTQAAVAVQGLMLETTAVLEALAS